MTDRLPLVSPVLDSSSLLCKVIDRLFLVSPLLDPNLRGRSYAGEPVAAIFEWLTDSLRDPGATYDLIGPDRKPIAASMGSIRKAQLLPSALLNFMRLSPAPQCDPTLKDDLLRKAS